MALPLASLPSSVRFGDQALPSRSAPARFEVAELAGRLVEISGGEASAALTLAVGLVLDAQRQGELAGWVTSEESSFYPPDVAESGVDLESLVVVRVPLGSRRVSVATAAERLTRSGAFALVVLQLGKNATVAPPLQSRLLGLAQRHHTALVCLTEKDERAPSLGSLVSLRAQGSREWTAVDRFRCTLGILKDKRRGPTWSHVEECRGPSGLR